MIILGWINFIKVYGRKVQMSDSEIEKGEDFKKVISSNSEHLSSHLETQPKQNSILEVITLFFKTDVKSWLYNKYNLAFLGVLLVAFLIRLRYIGQESIWNDSAVHLWYAIKVLQEPLFIFSRQYLLGDYTIPQTIMSFFYLFTGNILLAGQIITMLYALIGIIFIYLLGTELKNKFAGILAAILLTFNHIAWFYGARPLGDSPLLTTTIILLYCMVRLEKEKTAKWGIFSGIFFIAAIFTKVQAMLFSLAVIIYVLLFKRKEMFKERGTLYSWIIPAAFLLLAHVFGKIVFNASILDRVFKLFLDTRGMPFGFEAFGMINWIFSWQLLLLSVLGLILILFYKEKKYYFSITLFFFYWLFFEVNVDNTQDRYILPLFAVGIILAVFALEEIRSFFELLFGKNKIFYLIPIILVLFISWNYYQTGDSLIYNKTFSYTGYQEAGQWIKDNVPITDPIFAGEYRSMRLFTEREFGGPPPEEYGGTIINLRSPYRYTEIYDNVSQKNFEEDVLNWSKNSDIYLEIDIWEYYQPKWYFPLSQKSLEYFTNFGFNLVKVIERDVMTNEGPKKVPVIFIFKKDQIKDINNA